MTIKWRSQWADNDDEDKIAKTTALDFTGTTTIVDQEAAEDTDINVIMKRFGVKDGSALPYWDDPKGIYGDISQFPQDPTELANIMLEGQRRFMGLPANVRQRYPSPEALFEFLSNDDNHREARELGLLRPETIEELEKKKEAPPPNPGRTEKKTEAAPPNPQS